MGGLMIPTTNPPYPPFAKGGKQNHDTATDLPVFTCTPLCKRGVGGDFQRGISLVELIMFIIIVSVALAGILLVFNVTTKGSADPLIHKQALAAAESLLEEIQLQDFIAEPGESPDPVNTENRANAYHIVRDYNGFSMPSQPGIYALKDPLEFVTGLTGYSARVEVGAPVNIGSPPASAVLITVTVTDPQGTQIAIDGYRTEY